MALAHAILNHVKSLPDPAVDQALADTLATADAPSLAPLLRVVLQRKQPAGLVGAVASYHRLSPALQSEVITSVDDLYGALRQITKRRAAQPRANAVEIIRRAKAARLAYLLAEELRHAPAGLCRAAGDALLELAQWASSDPDPDAESYFDTESAAYLQTAVEDALGYYAHHQCESVLLALAAFVPRPLLRRRGLLDDPSHPAVKDYAVALTGAGEPLLRRAMLFYLALPTLTEAALDGLRMMVQRRQLREALTHGHLLSVPGIARQLSKAPTPSLLMPAEEEWRKFDHFQLRAMPAWIMGLHLDAPSKADELARLRQAPDAPTRLGALRRLIELSRLHRNPEAERHIADFTRDADANVARLALRHLIRQDWPELPSLLLALVNSPHSSVRLLAGAHVSPLGFERLWQAWPRLSYANQLAAGRALIKIDPRFHVHLGDKLARADDDCRLRALEIIRTLNQAEVFERPLLSLAADADARVASAAVRALGALTTHASVHTLERSLNHPDSRVRANAVEALEQVRSVNHVNQLTDMAQRDENRPRANAIGALMELRFNDALSALSNMLGDDRPRHRISGLWLVEHMGLNEMARQVTELAVRDPDHQVRQRAGLVMQRLIESLNTSAELLMSAGKALATAQETADAGSAAQPAPEVQA